MHNSHPDSPYCEKPDYVCTECGEWFDPDDMHDEKICIDCYEEEDEDDDY